MHAGISSAAWVEGTGDGTRLMVQSLLDVPELTRPVHRDALIRRWRRVGEEDEDGIVLVEPDQVTLLALGDDALVERAAFEVAGASNAVVSYDHVLVETDEGIRVWSLVDGTELVDDLGFVAGDRLLPNGATAFVRRDDRFARLTRRTLEVPRWIDTAPRVDAELAARLGSVHTLRTLRDGAPYMVVGERGVAAIHRTDDEAIESVAIVAEELFGGSIALAGTGWQWRTLVVVETGDEWVIYQLAHDTPGWGRDCASSLFR